MLNNEIVKGIASALYDAFGDEYHIYQDDIEQGLEEPCFFVGLLKPSLSPLLGRRAKLEHAFDIRYFPTHPRENAEMCAVAETLLLALRFITLPNGDKVHGTAMSYEIESGVLHFFVNYNLTVLFPAEEVPLMETLDMEQNTKGAD